MKILRSIISLIVLWGLVISIAFSLDAMEAVLEDRVTVKVNNGETVVVSKKEWELLKNACSVPVGGLNDQSNPTFTNISRIEFDDLRTHLNLLASLDNNRTVRMKKAYEEYCKRLEKSHAEEIEALNVVANDPQLLIRQRNEARHKLQKEAARYVALQEKKREYEARFETEDEHLASLVNLSLFCTFLAQKDYDRYISLLMQADYLGIDCILNDLDALLEITSAALMGEDVSACPPFVLIDGYQGNGVDHESIRAFLQALLALPCVDISKREDFSRRILLYASKMGYAELVKFLVSRKGVSPDLRKESDEAALTLASRAGHVRIVKRLLRENAEVDATNSWGHTPLMLASVGGYREIVQLLLDYGSWIDRKDKQGDTALSHTGHLEIARLLLSRGARVDVCNALLCTPLMAAVESCLDAEGLVEFLLEARAPVDAQDILGNTALILAAGLGKTDIVRSLLKKRTCTVWGLSWILSYFAREGAQPNLCTKQGITALMNAARKGHVDIIALLHKAGADLEAKDKNDSTALVYAAQEGHIDAVKALLEAGARDQIRGAHKRALEGGHREAAEVLARAQAFSCK